MKVIVAGLLLVSALVAGIGAVDPYLLPVEARTAQVEDWLPTEARTAQVDPHWLPTEARQA